MEVSSKRKDNKGNATQWAGIFEKKFAGTDKPKPGKQKIKNGKPNNYVGKSNQNFPSISKAQADRGRETQLVINKIEMSGEILSAEAMEQPRRQS